MFIARKPIVRRTVLKKDRKDYMLAYKDFMDLFSTIAAELRVGFLGFLWFLSLLPQLYAIGIKYPAFAQDKELPIAEHLLCLYLL